MKKIIILLVSAFALLTACTKDNFLDPRTTGLTDDQVFSDSTRTLAFLSRIYADQLFAFSKTRWQGNSNSEQMTDDAEYIFLGTDKPPVQYYLGLVSPVSFLGDGSTYSNINASDCWVLPWQNIRRCNLLLNRLPGTPLSARLKARMAAETRFLRAWYLDQLISQFGGVPLIGNTLYEADDFINIPRDTYSDCVDYLVAELDFCATQLPDISGAPKAGAAGYSSVDYSRVTSGTALALKSRVLLRAASPLFNGGAETTDPSLAALVSYPINDPARWQRAAAAAKAVMDLNQYSLVVDNTTKRGYGFYNVFLQRVNNEYIYSNGRSAGNKDFENFYYPGTRGGNRYSTPTQEIVDAFPMANGKAITDATSGYNPNNPYVNRDPRFRYSIIFNGSGVYSSAGSVQPVYTYNGPGATVDAISLNGPSTGYFFRKMCDSTTAPNAGAGTNRSWPLIRYAEILLNYAEALNEIGQTEPALQHIFALRQRAGILPGTNSRYGIAVGISQADARTLIRNERRIELLNEDQRLMDLRRWKLAMTVLNQISNRMSIVNTGTATARTYTYSVVPVSVRPKHSFRPEMYLLPLPDAEIRKVPLMRQNPGW